MDSRHTLEQAHLPVRLPEQKPTLLPILIIARHPERLKSVEISGIGNADMTGPTNVVAGSINTCSLPAIPGASYSWVADGGQVVGGWNTRTISVKAGTINGYVHATLKNAFGTAPVAKKYFFVQGATNCPSHRYNYR